MIRIILSKILRYIHILVCVIIFFGIFLPAKYLIYYLFLGLFMYLHWHFNDNQCMLSELEYKLDDKFLSNIKEMNKYKYRSILDLFKNFGIYFDNIDNFIKLLTKSGMILWVIGFIRYLVYYRKNISNFWSTIKKSLVRRLINDSYK